MSAFNFCVRLINLIYKLAKTFIYFKSNNIKIITKIRKLKGRDLALKKERKLDNVDNWFKVY